MTQTNAQHKTGGMTRRTFAEWAAVLGGTCALAGAAVPRDALAADAPEAPDAGPADPAAPQAPTAPPLDYDEVVWGGCHVNCGSRCPLKLYVKDGVVVRVGIDDQGSDAFGPGQIYQMRSCVRGRTSRQRLYNETRIQTPLRRVPGTKRGEGKFEAITWDEAIDQIASAMKAVKEKYGNDAFYIQYGTGQLGGTVSKSWAPDNTAFARLLNCYGGYLRQYADYSTGQITWEMPLLNGDAWSNNEVMDLVNSKNIVLFGNNPANTRMSGSAMAYLLTQVRLQNPDAKIVVIDPILSDTAVGVANQWVPIRPGTDMALVAGMVHHLLVSGKLDEALVRERFIGFYSDTFFDEVALGEPPNTDWFGYDATGSLTVDQDMSYEAYLRGTGFFEGTGEKTSAWASAITGVPAQTIEQLAELYLDGPTATIQGWGPQRHMAGGNSSRAVALIAAITGNAGISGGGTGAREAVGGVPYAVPGSIPNLSEKNQVDRVISFFAWYQAIEDYRSMNDATWGVRAIDPQGTMHFAETPGTLQLKAPIKFVWNYASNVMAGQHGDINEMLRIYNLPDEDDSGLTMVVTHDVYLTPTAMVSDIVLPGTTSFEEADVATGGSAWTGFVCCERPAVEPLFEAKPVYEVCCLLADKLGILDEFSEGRTQEDWVRWVYDQGVANGADLPPTFGEFWVEQYFKQTDDHAPAVYVPPEHLATPSGRYEVFSKQAYNLSKQWDVTCGGYVPNDGLGDIYPLPQFYVAPEGVGDEDPAYPFILIGQHQKTRTHSSYGNVEWMASAAPQELWINTQDAAGLGIANGDLVEVYNQRGRVQVPARVTPRIMPGVLSLPQGAWYDPDLTDPELLGDPGVLDRGGCVSVLTSVRPTPISKGNGVHTARAAVAKL